MGTGQAAEVKGRRIYFRYFSAIAPHDPAPLYLKRFVQPEPPQQPPGRGRVIFSSSSNSSDQAAREKIAGREGFLLSRTSAGIHGVAAALFTTIFPSDCRICGNPLI